MNDKIAKKRDRQTTKRNFFYLFIFRKALKMNEIERNLNTLKAVYQSITRNIKI